MDIVSIDLDGMNLIVLKKRCNSKNIILKPEFKDNEIIGTLWYESEAPNSLVVSIIKRTSHKFHIISDIAKTLYNHYYKDNDEYPSLIHV